jgi:cell wall-associated NlpC family hydrolase
MKKILTLLSHGGVLLVVMYGFFTYSVFTVSADNNIFGIPGTTLLSGDNGLDAEGKVIGPCADKDSRTCYEFLEPLPVTDESGRDAVATAIVVDAEEGSIGKSFNNFYYMAIGIGSVLAVIMIVMYGFRYMTGDQGGYNKQKLKDKITNAVLGILLLLGIWIILNTINPDLLNVNPVIDGVNIKALEIIDTGGDTESPVYNDAQIKSVSQSFKKFAANNGIHCPGSGGSAEIPKIAESMVGKITYSMQKRGTSGPGGTWYLDCSFFVYTVYSCAGLPSPGQTTSVIFPKAQKIDQPTVTATSINGRLLRPGDLIGWMSGPEGPKNEKFGHVVMYIGNGKAIESTSGDGGKNPGKGVQIKPANAYTIRLDRFLPL